MFTRKYFSIVLMVFFTLTPQFAHALDTRAPVGEKKEITTEAKKNNSSSNPSVIDSGAQKNLQDMQKNKAAEEAAKQLNQASNLDNTKEKPKSGLGSEGTKDAQKIIDTREEKAKANDAKLLTCTKKCEKSTFEQLAIEKAKKNPSSLGSGINAALKSAEEQAKEDAYYKNASPSEKKMLDEAKAKAKAAKKQEEQAALAKAQDEKKKALEMCVKDCMCE